MDQLPPGATTRELLRCPYCAYLVSARSHQAARSALVAHLEAKHPDGAKQ